MKWTPNASVSRAGPWAVSWARCWPRWNRASAPRPWPLGARNGGYLLKASVVAEALGLNKGDHPLDPKVFRRIVAPADPIHWAQKISPRPVLMLNAKHDILVNPLSNKMLFARLKAPKKIVWFDDGHGLDMDLALDYIMRFFGAYLVGDADPMEIGVAISGHQTAPLDMGIKPLPEPWISMPLLDRFEYDSFLPLHLKSTEIKSTDTRRVADVSFLTAHDKTVAATLRTPAPESSVRAMVVYLHEFGADRTQAASLAEDMYARNTALLALDMEYHGARAIDGRAMISPLVDTSRDAIIQTVIDVRRAPGFPGHPARRGQARDPHGPRPHRRGYRAHGRRGRRSHPGRYPAPGPEPRGHGRSIQGHRGPG